MGGIFLVAFIMLCLTVFYPVAAVIFDKVVMKSSKSVRAILAEL